MSDILIIDEDLQYHQQQKALGRNLFRRVGIICLLAPLIYLPLFYILQHVLKIEFAPKMWIIWAITMPLFGLLIEGSLFLSVYFRQRCTLTSEGIRFGPPLFVFIRWSKLKRWKIVQIDEPTHLSKLVIYRLIKHPIDIVLPSDLKSQDVVDFITGHGNTAEQDAAANP